MNNILTILLILFRNMLSIVKIFIWLDIFLSYFMISSFYKSEFYMLIHEVLSPFKLITKRIVLGPFNLSSLVTLLIINFLIRNI